MDAVLRARSIRTLAWLGDAAFEKEVRWRVAARGDFPTDRLDAIKAEVVRAEAQAALLEAIEGSLDEEELGVARRGRNATLPGSGKRRNVQAYRAATALESLVGHWELSGERGRARYEQILLPHVDAAIEAAVERRRDRPRRG